MSFSKPNASAATVTTTRVTPAPISGICVTCVDGCPGYCEVGKSALRGREVMRRIQIELSSPPSTFQPKLVLRVEKLR